MFFNVKKKKCAVAQIRLKNTVPVYYWKFGDRWCLLDSHLDEG